MSTVKPFNPNKKISNPKLNHVSQGQSTRTQKAKPLDTRLGWDNGRSKKTVTKYKFYPKKVNDSCLIKSVKQNTLKSEINTQVNSWAPYKVPNGSQGYRVYHYDHNLQIESSNRSRYESICKKSEPINVDKHWTLSPSHRHLIIIEKNWFN
jgi:hypothetical protein